MTMIWVHLCVRIRVRQSVWVVRKSEDSLDPPCPGFRCNVSKMPRWSCRCSATATPCYLLSISPTGDHSPSSPRKSVKFLDDSATSLKHIKPIGFSFVHDVHVDQWGSHTQWPLGMLRWGSESNLVMLLPHGLEGQAGQWRAVVLKRRLGIGNPW